MASTSGAGRPRATVDLAQAFTSMVTSQRGFQANSGVVASSDANAADLVNLKRQAPSRLPASG
jgi:hypothetical protein